MLPTQGALSSSEDESAPFLLNVVQKRSAGVRRCDLSFKMFSERAKPEQSGDAKPRVLIKDSRVAEEMS
jgi:hypothetical protein